MARPRKFHGQREAFMTRMQKDLADTVKTEAEARGISYSEYIALIVGQAHGVEAELPPKKKPTPRQDTLEDAMADAS